ncbi:MAG: dephospho-CoA kinase [Rickettsiales bacterium]|jgi:dephospho-CoA kinase
MLIIGLTGGVASGKNFVANHFEKLNIPVYDADLEVHKLLSEDREIFLEIKNKFPAAIQNCQIDRKILGKEVLSHSQKLADLEQIIYPKLRQQENSFIKKHFRRRSKMVVLNIPLLFEKGGYKKCDKTIVIIAPNKVRFNRFAKRFSKNKDYSLKSIEEKFVIIKNNQISDLERKKRADFLIYNGLGKAFCINQIESIIKKICKE